MATLRSMRRLCGRWRRRGYITNRRPRLPSSFAAVTFTISQRACLPSGLSFIANPRWSHRLTVARWRSEYAGVMHRPSALVQFQGRAYKIQCCPNLWFGVRRVFHAPESERPPRGGPSEIRSDVLIRRLRVKQRSSASCASRADPTRQGRWRRVGGRRGVECR